MWPSSWPFNSQMITILLNKVKIHRDMLALEKNKSLALRRELDELTIVAQHRKLQDSVQFVPGVSAVAVIEICAGRITRLEHELGLAKAQLQLQPRNREVRMAKQRAADGLASLADGLFSEHNKGGMQLTYSPSCSEPQLRHILFETQLLTHRARVSELEEEVSQLLTREFELPPEVEIDRAELSNCRKQLELFKVELKCKNDEIVLLKKSLSLMHSKVQEQTFDRQMERPSQRNHQLVSIVRDPPSSDREDELHLQLRQCNCEIGTLRETIAALQTDSIFNEENKSGASRLEFDVLPSLRKKVLEFSLELSHGKSLRLLAEHQAHICLRQVGARDQEVRGLREQIKTLEEEVVEHRLLSAGLTERLKEAARLEADSRRIAEEEKEDLLSALRQLELERCSQEILVRQLNEQLKQQQRPQTPHSTACPVNDDDFDAEVLTVDDDILSLIQVVKNVSDLEDPHRKRLIEHLLKASTRNIDEKKIEFARKSFEQRLARVIALLRSEERKVRALSECIANQEACVSAKMSIISHHGIRSIMRRQQHDKEMVEMYLSECERSAAAEMKIETTSALVGKLRLRVIELEEFRSGGSSAECREGATDCMFDYIRHVEEDMKQWRESELPMLLTSHLNIENISQICFTNGTLSTKVDAERCAQLASALAVTKTQLSAALMRCSYLTEEVTSLKNRNLLLQSNTEEVSERVEEDDSSTGRDRKQFPSSSGDKEAQFLRFACHHVPELESRVDALEEEIVDFQETALVAELRAKVAEHALLAIQEEGRKLEENHLRAVSELRLQHEIRVSKLKRGLMKNEHEGERADDSYQLPAPILQPLSPQFFGDSTQSVSGKQDQLTAQAQRVGYLHGAEV